MRVYIVRHGESVNNVESKWTGWMDVPLTDKGIEDAKRAGKLLSGIEFKKVYASDLDRAKETAKNAIPGCRIEENTLLREVNVGVLAGNQFNSIGKEERKEIAKSGYVAFGGETDEEFRGRVGAFMKLLEKNSEENIAVFSHAGWIRTFLDLVAGTRLPRANVLCNNCTVGVFEYTDGIWKIHSWINLD